MKVKRSQVAKTSCPGSEAATLYILFTDDN